MKKRVFIRLIMVGLLLKALVGAAGDNPADLQSMAQSDFVTPKLSLQLWSVKDDVKADFEGTIRHIASLGFSGVEFAGEFGSFKNNGQALKQFLDAVGLQSSGAHINFEQLNEENFDQTVAFYQAAGIDWLIVPWDERAWHPEGIKEVVKELNLLAKKLAPLSMKIGFHNHAREFGEFMGVTYWDYLALNTSEEVVLQLDVGWTVFAGKDPIEYVKRYPGRTLTTHYKVHASRGKRSKSYILGEDDINWLELSKVSIAVGGTQWFVVEQEVYPEGLTPLQAVEKSKLGLDQILKEL